ncbi:MAG TPA: M20/M25/M40 family metallo-hydrolase [Candidatus Limnocylindrales bacterium]|nr:M20/M25/M40 family metallo-hydrolase [Candidatus Limnocylindrales bacterium]
MGSVIEETTDLLQHLIRNACVNDGTLTSGGEIRNVDTLMAYLQGPGVEMKRYEPEPGRGSFLLRIEGSDPKAPTLLFMGHADVVPANAAGWRHDPFGGELINGEVWGRGAVDMLNVTASMAVAVHRLIDGGFRPKGTLLYSAMADEEALGTWGAQWLTDNAWDDVRCDYVVTEFGGARLPLPTTGGVKLPLMAAEKGSNWVQLRVKGTPSHGSMPLRTDNAVVKAAEIIRRIAAYRPAYRLGDHWQRFVSGMEFPDELRAKLSRSEGMFETLQALPTGVAREFDAVLHTTFAPTIVKGGTKINIIPDMAEVQVDIRTLPGDERAEVRAMLREAIGDLWEHVEIINEGDNPATSSPLDTPLWDVLTNVSARLVPGSTTVPGTIVGATDSRFFRRRGAVAYGYGLLSERISYNDFIGMFHGNDERVDQESLRLCVELWEQTARELLGRR